MTVHVIGLGGRDSLEGLRDLLTRARVVARNSQLAEPLLPAGVSIDVPLDTWFDGEIDTGLPGKLAVEIAAASQRGTESVYLVPGSGVTGDVTVAALAKVASISIHPGRHDLLEPTGQVQIVDALHLALAELDHPFDAGLAPIDSQVAVLVTNLYGARIVELAAHRLRRSFPHFHAQSVAGGEILIEAADPLESARALSGFEQIISRLRSPDGCPWDREQSAASLHPQLLEEVEELGEAIEKADSREVAEELGDVLLHIVMIAQIAREQGLFDLQDVIAAVAAKMVRRHPHVFGDLEITSIEELYENWDRIKAAEKAKSGGR